MGHHHLDPVIENRKVESGRLLKEAWDYIASQPALAGITFEERMYIIAKYYLEHATDPELINEAKVQLAYYDAQKTTKIAEAQQIINETEQALQVYTPEMAPLITAYRDAAEKQIEEASATITNDKNMSM